LHAGLIAAGLVFSAGTVALAGEYTVAEISDLRPDDLKVTAFVVTGDMEVRVAAVGGRHKHSDRMFAYPWLLNAETRCIVWSMDEEFTHRYKGSSYLRESEDDLSLKKGTYELYYFAGRPRFDGSNIQIDDLGDLKELLKDILGSGDRPSDRKLARQFYVRVLSDSDSFEELSTVPGPPAAVVQLARPDNDRYLHQGFIMNKQAELEVYAAGEYSEWSEVMVDWGWIVNAATRDRVWEMDRWNSEWAGGAEKNRVSRETITLPEGEYVAGYATDDSHTYESWNDNPPYDPEAWGLRIRPVTAADAQAIRPAEVTLPEKAIIEIVEVCDNEFLSEGFRLKSPADLYIYAIGEDDRYSDRLADYGWISDAETGKRIWIMDNDNTKYAGGNVKNRMFDEVITLEAGEYVVHYVTDGSHSYCDWNASPPYDQKAYGIMLSLCADDAGKGIVTLFEPSAGPTGALAGITCVHDDERRKQRFTLEKVTRIRIHAAGEGDRDDMYDYGWIESADDGTIVWEMTYRKTVHAGGAKKNRLVDQKILLDKGNYVVYYVSDGSHSCNDWNADPPDDPFSWGIIITEAKK